MDIKKQKIIDKYNLDIKEDIIINDSEESITCRICGKQSIRLYGRHFKHVHNGITSKEYLLLFGDVPIRTSIDKYKGSVNSGKHMKLDKYRKMFSEKIKGENNPMHRSKTTAQQRKENSPFSEEFYRKRFPELNDDEIKEKVSSFAKNALKDRLLPSNVEYWEQKGYSKEESIKKVSESQTTFSKEICIQKYGEEKGLKVWLDRQERWHKNYEKSNFSKISQELYQSIWEIIKNDNNISNEIFFATLNKNKEIEKSRKNYEYRLRLNKSYILPDFFIKNKKKIIEFDGTYYHRKTPENKKREYNRDKNIKDSGYSVLHITESEYHEDKNKTIQKCIDFIYN